MCLVCNGGVPDQRFRFDVGAQVVFKRHAPEKFRQAFPGILRIEQAVDNAVQVMEKQGFQTLALTDEHGIEVVVSGIRQFSSDLFNPTIAHHPV